MRRSAPTAFPTHESGRFPKGRPREVISMSNMQYVRRIWLSSLKACSTGRAPICYRLAHISARIWLEHTLSKWSCLGGLLLQQPTNNTPRHQGIVKALSEVLQVPSKPAHHNTRIKAQKGPEREGGTKTTECIPIQIFPFSKASAAKESNA